ncbi:MAG TPA: hypothetical protein PLF40_04715 [Kofleriaceae bacterium]|nr:hypothetical protein [Kofleriaceae bacterium]
MRNFFILAALVFSTTACGKSGVDGKLDELAKIKDTMCACKDKTCTDATQEKYVAWKKGNSKDDKPNEEQMKKFEGIRKELQDCRRKVADGADAGAGSAMAPTPVPEAPPAGSAAPAAPAAPAGSAAPAPTN